MGVVDKLYKTAQHGITAMIYARAKTIAAGECVLYCQWHPQAWYRILAEHMLYISVSLSLFAR